MKCVVRSLIGLGRYTGSRIGRIHPAVDDSSLELLGAIPVGRIGSISALGIFNSPSGSGGAARCSSTAWTSVEASSDIKHCVAVLLVKFCKSRCYFAGSSDRRLPTATYKSHRSCRISILKVVVVVDIDAQHAIAQRARSDVAIPV